MSTKTFALNRDLHPILEALAAQKGAPLWVELIPTGNIQDGKAWIEGRDGRTWVNNNPQGIVDAFEANGADLPIDVEHATELKAPNGDPAPAVGWIKALEVRDGGSIWGLVEWNDEGRWLVQDKSYRYLSPVFTYNTKTKRILQLYSAGLTNQPNLHLTALNQRIKPTGDDAMLAICTALGLSAEATEAQAVSAINQLKDEKDKALNSANSPSLERFVPRADHEAALNRAEQAENKLKKHEEVAMNQQIEDALDKALKKGVITPVTVDYHRACCKQEGGLDRFSEYLKSAPEMCGDSGLDKKTINQNDKGLSNEDKAACSLLGLNEDEYLKAKEAA